MTHAPRRPCLRAQGAMAPACGPWTAVQGLHPGPMSPLERPALPASINCTSSISRHNCFKINIHPVLMNTAPSPLNGLPNSRQSREGKQGQTHAKMFSMKHAFLTQAVTEPGDLLLSGRREHRSFAIYKKKSAKYLYVDAGVCIDFLGGCRGHRVAS